MVKMIFHVIFLVAEKNLLRLYHHLNLYQCNNNDHAYKYYRENSTIDKCFMCEDHHSQFNDLYSRFQKIQGAYKPNFHETIGFMENSENTVYKRGGDPGPSATSIVYKRGRDPRAFDQFRKITDGL
jgi:hypothetical protein